jgi:glycerol uptake facilitator-like aquaporin
MQDPQLEFFWTLIWSFLSCWTFGAPQVLSHLPRDIFNGPALFFLLCVGFWELKTMSVTNPAYWIKDMLVDVMSKRRLPRARRWVLMAAVDCCGWIAGYWLYVKTLSVLNQMSIVEVALQPPIKDLKVGYIHGMFSEIMVTFLTQIAPLFGDVVGLNPRLNNILASFIGVRIMLWGIPKSGAAMNPASSLAATFWWLRSGKSEPFNKTPLNLFDIVLIYVISPSIGALLAAILETMFVMRGMTSTGSPSPRIVPRKRKTTHDGSSNGTSTSPNNGEVSFQTTTTTTNDDKNNTSTIEINNNDDKKNN